MLSNKKKADKTHRKIKILFLPASWWVVHFVFWIFRPSTLVSPFYFIFLIFLQVFCFENLFIPWRNTWTQFICHFSKMISSTFSATEERILSYKPKISSLFYHFFFLGLHAWTLKKSFCCSIGCGWRIVKCRKIENFYVGFPPRV